MNRISRRLIKLAVQLDPELQALLDRATGRTYSDWGADLALGGIGAGLGYAGPGAHQTYKMWRTLSPPLLAIDVPSSPAQAGGGGGTAPSAPAAAGAAEAAATPAPSGTEAQSPAATTQQSTSSPGETKATTAEGQGGGAAAPKTPPSQTTAPKSPVWSRWQQLYKDPAFRPLGRRMAVGGTASVVSLLLSWLLRNQARSYRMAAAEELARRVQQNQQLAARLAEQLRAAQQRRRGLFGLW